METAKSGMKAGRGRTRPLAVLAMGVAGATLLLNPFAGTSPAAETPQIQAYQLRAIHSDKNAAVTGGSAADGAAIVQKAPASVNSQGWVPLPFGSAWIMVNANSGKVLDVAGGSTQLGAVLTQQAFGATAAQVESQVWFIIPFGEGTVVFANYKSGQVMDVSGASAGDDVPLTQWQFHGAPNQRWSGVAVGVPVTTTSSTTVTTVTPTTVTPTTVTPTTVTPTTVTPTTVTPTTI